MARDDRTRSKAGSIGACGTRPPVTEFQQRVYAAVSAIPRGRVVTYAELARHVGCGSAQAVGQALRRNPFAPQVPCHRVVPSDLTPGGYCGRTTGRELSRKLALLEAEGVFFADGVLVDAARKCYRFGRAE